MAIILSILSLLLTMADVYISLVVVGSTSWLVKGWLFLPALVYCS